MLGSATIEPNPAPIGRLGGTQGRPEYMVQPSDLRPVPGSCTVCRSPLVVLSPDVPPGEQGGHDQGPPKLDLLGDLRRHLGPHECDKCRLRSAVAALFPSRPPGAVTDPVAAELAALRAERQGPTPPPADLPEKGARFKVGTVLVTPAALAALAAVKVPRFDPAVNGMAEIARPDALDLVREHSRTKPTGDAEYGRRMGPLSRSEDRAALAVRDDRYGVVQTTHRLERVDPARWEGGNRLPEKSTRAELRITTDPADGLTLVALPAEVPNF